MNKASRKKREKSSAKKERKATKTLAIVLGKSRALSNTKIYTFSSSIIYVYSLITNTGVFLVFISNFRGFPHLLGTILHLQHNGCNVQQIKSFLSARCSSISSHYVVRLYEQFRKSCHLYNFQSRVSESLQKTYVSRALSAT